jgi:DNA-binding MarR family transcriptional regulator
MSDRKLPPYDAMPPRAASDERFSIRHFRALMVIARHDRFSQYTGGQACWASAKTLASETGMHGRTMQLVIADLIAWGYLIEDRRSQNRRHLAVVYEDEVRVEETHTVRVEETHTVRVDVTQTESLPLNKPIESDCAEAGRVKNSTKNVEVNYTPSLREIATTVVKRMPPELRMSEARFRHKRDEIIKAGEVGNIKNGHTTWPKPTIAARLGLKPADSLG